MRNKNRNKKIVKIHVLIICVDVKFLHYIIVFIVQLSAICKSLTFARFAMRSNWAWAARIAIYNAQPSTEGIK